MKYYYPFIIVSVLLVFFIFFFSPVIYAQNATINQKTIPSDLMLDLQLAQQNPAPDQKQLVNLESSKVLVTTTTGKQNIIIPTATVAPQASTEPITNAIQPQLTTSEQIVIQPVTIQENNTSPIPTSGSSQENTSNTNGNIIPGTNISVPDDNAAPSDNSTNPNLPGPTAADESPSQTPGNQQMPTGSVSSVPDNGSGGMQQTTQAPQSNTQSTDSTQNTDNSQQSIPLESQPQDNSVISQQPADNTSQPDQTSSDNSPQPTADTSSSDSPTDAVQGIATGPQVKNENILQQIMHSIENFFLGK